MSYSLALGGEPYHFFVISSFSVAWSIIVRQQFLQFAVLVFQ